MNPMLQRHCAKFIYIVPDGLRELMSDISREVIRTQPENIYTFIADFLDALMITRENARIAARLVDGICEIAETTVELLLRIGLSRTEADAVVAVMQTAFREYLEKKKKSPPAASHEILGEWGGEEEDFTHRIMSQLPLSVCEEKQVEAAVIIQNAWRKFKERKEREKEMLFGMVDWRIAARSAIMLYRKTGVTMYEANRAATLIKAAYKGYYTRRIMRRLLHMGVEDESTAEFSTIGTDDNVDFSSESGEYHGYYRGVETYGEGSGGFTSGSRVDYLNLEADTADTRAIAAAPHPSWTGPTEGQVTEEGQTLPIDGEAETPEDAEVTEGEVLPEIRGESQSTVEASTEEVPPNTEQEGESEPVEVVAAEAAAPAETGDAEPSAEAEAQPDAPAEAEPAAEPAAEAEAEPVQEEPTAEPAAEPSEPTDEPPSEPASEPVTDAEDATTDYTTDDTEAG